MSSTRQKRQQHEAGPVKLEVGAERGSRQEIADPSRRAVSQSDRENTREIRDAAGFHCLSFSD
ncbi:MAG TPA: hypothetical protein DC058_24055 [Planctomycetaceae bacterium]|nr:hypothetical protein [Planctomycetaceae bacterium]HBC64275.1 hypothetical protein [Planctomycetaceae bacterium]